MDPNSALASLRMYLAMARDYSEAADEGNYSDTEVLWDIIDGLADHTEALDGWLMMGGALPDSWEDAR